jgi:hypothetical protein
LLVFGGVTVCVLTLVVFVPPLRGLFSLGAAPAALVGAGLVAGTLPVLLVDTVRGLAYRMLQKAP